MLDLYKEPRKILNEYLARIYEYLCHSGTLPQLSIKKLSRTKFSKYYHEVTCNGVEGGEIFINSQYLPQNPTNKEILYFIMLIAHDLCQCVAICQNEGKKIAPHGREVQALLKKVGILYRGALVAHGPKQPLIFTKDERGRNEGLLYELLADAYPEAIAAMVIPEIKPAEKKEPRPVQMSFWQQQYEELQKENECLLERVKKLSKMLEPRPETEPMPEALVCAQ